MFHSSFIQSRIGATAQVTPLELTLKLMSAAEAKGANVIIETVEGIVIESGAIRGVKIKGKPDLLADVVLVCMGPWSAPFVEDNFGIPLPMEGVKSTSLVYNNLDEIKSEPAACFCDEDENDCHLELYPRNNGDLYICGCGGSDYVRGDRLRDGGDCDSAEKIHADPHRVQAACRSFSSMSSLGARRAPDIVQACMRPCADDGMPVMGKIPEISGAYVSTGHNCWGILWAPIAGLAMAQLITNGICSVIDLSSFDISRFTPRSNERARGKKVGDANIGEQW